MSLLPDDPRHGTANGYSNLDCRCDACLIAGRADNREKQAWKKMRARRQAQGLTSRGTRFKREGWRRRATGL